MTGLDFHILGPVAVLRDGVDVKIGGPKPRGVLALLVAHRNRTVSLDSLAESVWPSGSLADPAGSVQVVISALRRAIGDPSGQVLRTSPPGYRLTLDETDCDAGRFARHREAGRAAAASGRHGEAAAHLRLALAEWSGPAFSDLRGTRFADDLAVPLEELRAATVESRIAADLESGAHAAVVGELAALTAENPLRETLWSLYMLALYRCGRQAEALGAARDLRTTLRDELGLSPSAEVSRLEAAILRQDADLLAVHGAPAATATIVDIAGDSRAVLVGTDGTTRELDGGRVRVGRTADNDLVLDDPKVSREHAVIRWSGSAYILSDLRSTNGTTVNGARIVEHHVLVAGDLIGIGSSEFEFRPQT